MKRSLHTLIVKPETRRVSCLVGLMLGVFAAAHATVHIQRRYDRTNGLVVPTVFSMAQDADGFLWLGTAGGLVRYDGVQMRPWAKETINRDVYLVIANAKGEVLTAEGEGALYRITSSGVELLPGPDGKPFSVIRDATFDSLEQLWVIAQSGALHVFDTQHAWHTFPDDSFSGELVRRVRPAPGGGAYVLTDKAVWQANLNGARKLVEIMRPLDVIAHPNGSLFVLGWKRYGEVVEFREGRATVRVSLLARPIDLVLRDRVVWVSYDRYVVALREDGSQETIGPDDNLPSGGPLLVDREGSLWVGTFDGLIQYPEPETIIWNYKDGLPSSHGRALARTAEGIWDFSWQGLGLLERAEKHWRARDQRLLTSRPCTDNHELLMFTAADGSLVERRAGHFIARPFLSKDDYLSSCTRAADGDIWIATGRGIFRLGAGNHSPEPINSPTSTNGQAASVFKVFRDRNGTLWAGMSDGRLCQARVDQAVAARPISWTCQAIKDAPDVFDFVEFPSGSLWMATDRAGMFRYVRGQWEMIPASANLPSQVLFKLVASPAGGAWIVGHGITARVIERPDTKDGWEVVEVVSLWHGAPGSGAGDLIEDPDGNLWLSTASGVVNVPPHARHAEAGPPKVKLVDVIFNGQSVALEVVREIKYGAQAELHFAALSFRDRNLLRYQYRLRPDSEWIDLRDSSPVLRFVDLRAGDYRAEVRASLDGQHWSAAPAAFSFKVLAPWYLQTWAIALVALTALIAAYGIHRARLAVLIRLERQRAQIARDLHDEIGSGLGSIGILSGLAAENSLENAEQRDIAKKIAETAGELGTTLSEIVWALKPGTATLEALAYHLAERGGRLFPGGATNFKTDFPDQWPRVELSLAVRRNLLLIASEALHNSARHAQAQEITLGLQAVDGKKWRLWLNDDGQGISSPGAANGSGMGIENMRRRAEEIGASFRLAANRGNGTSVSIIFDPRFEGRTAGPNRIA